jgi:diadenylate cyclase
LQDFFSLSVFGDQTVKSSLIAVIDILIVAFITYRLLMLVRGTRGWRILLGLLVFAAALTLSDVLNLVTLHWILEKATMLGPVALVILFLPELRQTLEGLTKFSLMPERVVEAGHEKTLDRTAVEEIVGAVTEMARDRIGAILVIETGAHMDEIAAVIIRGDSILAAACRLPLSESARIDKTLHMRHRAAIGVTEQNDAVSIVVSEERGTISVVQEGKLQLLKTSAELREFLINQVTKDEPRPEPIRPFRKKDRDKDKTKVTAKTPEKIAEQDVEMASVGGKPLE